VAVLDDFANHGELPQSLAKQTPKVKPEKRHRPADPEKIRGFILNKRPGGASKSALLKKTNTHKNLTLQPGSSEHQDTGDHATQDRDA
jgi:hypothetical protein